jgi:hypothetical protein
MRRDYLTNFAYVLVGGGARPGLDQQVPPDRREIAPSADIFGHIQKSPSRHENAGRHLDIGAAHHLGRRLHRPGADIGSAYGAAGQLTQAVGAASGTRGERCFRWIRFSGSSACRPCFWHSTLRPRFPAADRWHQKTSCRRELRGSAPLRQSGADISLKYGNVLSQIGGRP